jgi:NTP pyrophosphatase (non-canonical NTP hydrolase)
MTKLEAIQRKVTRELNRAVQLHGPYNSAHEGYAVILEELDELWEEVRKKRSKRCKTAMRDEAAQVAATAMRFMLDLT